MDESFSDDDLSIIKFEIAKPSMKKCHTISTKSKPSSERTSSNNLQKSSTNLTKKSNPWVSSSFGGFSDTAFTTPLPKPKLPESTKSDVKRNKKEKETDSQKSLFAFSSQKESRKRHRHVDDNSSVTPSFNSLASNTKDVWAEKYSPMSRGDLAVHKKKVEEISDWLGRAQRNKKKHAAPILLMNGPPGAGKTACVRVLCAELGLRVKEWEGSTEQEPWADRSQQRQTYEERSAVDVYTSQSQSSQFHNFLLRANKYRALNITSSQTSTIERTQSDSNTSSEGSIILVEEMPNVFFRESTQFHDILRKYKYSGQCPIIFLLTDSNHGSSSHKLFPKDLMTKLGVVNISLNPVAPTLLLKLLNKVLNQESREKNSFSSPSSSIVDQISSGSHGDIRAAINTLQFVCRTDCADIKQALLSCQPKPSGRGAKAKQKSSKSSSSSAGPVFSPIGAKDSSIFLFHAVGKILYFKRGEPSKDVSDPPLCVPAHMAIHDRDPLLVNPEEVSSACPVSGELMTSFLHENYVDFLTSVNDLERASEYFSDADYVSSVWTAKEELQRYCVSVATRGFIHSSSCVVRHTDVRKNMGWKPLHKSQWFTTIKQAADNIITAKQVFKGHHWEPTVMCCEILPYISLTNTTLHDTGQIRFVQEMTHFSRESRSKPTRLDEKDTASDGEEETEASLDKWPSAPVTKKVDEEGDEETTGLPASQANILAAQEDEEILIEEFDD